MPSQVEIEDAAVRAYPTRDAEGTLTAFMEAFEMGVKWAAVRTAVSPQPSVEAIMYRDGYCTCGTVRGTSHERWCRIPALIEAVRAAVAQEPPALAEAAREIERLRTLIDLDRTGLAEALSKVKQTASGWDWLAAPDGGRMSYSADEWSEAVIRREVADLITNVEQIVDAALKASGDRADSAYRPASLAVRVDQEGT